MNMIETQNLTKKYADFTAVSNVSLHIQKGKVYGFLGPNGAGILYDLQGKTMLLPLFPC